MTYVVTSRCLGTKDRSCVEVCPVDCFYDIRKRKYNDKYGVQVEGQDGEPQVGQLMIHPDECINCGACVTECPVEAIFEDSEVPEEYLDAIKYNEEETLSMTDEELDAARCTSK